MSCRIAVSDNWQMDPNQGLMQSYGLALGNAAESARMFSNYTVQLQGTGYGLLELHSVNLN